MITSGFFPDVNGDRLYTNDFLAKWVHSFISNGIFNGDFTVTSGENMNVILPKGQAWINGYYCRNDGNITLPIANADGILKRKDIVVLRWDINTRNITAKVLTGAFASSPIAPQLIRDAEQYDLKLAEIDIAVGAISIKQSSITDTRLDNNVCGLVHAVVDHIDTTKLYQQIQSDLSNFQTATQADYNSWTSTKKSAYDMWTNEQKEDFDNWSEEQKADFGSWFDSIKGVLGEDEAGNLLSLINTHTGNKDIHTNTAEKNRWNLSSVDTCVKEKTTSFLTNDSIQEVQEDTIKTTNFLSNGDVEEIVKNRADDEVLYRKTTTFLPNGDIKETII